MDRRHENIDPAGMGFCVIALFFFRSAVRGLTICGRFRFLNYCKKTTLIEKEHGRVGRCRVWSEVHCAELLLGCFAVVWAVLLLSVFSFCFAYLLTATKLKKLQFVVTGRQFER